MQAPVFFPASKDFGTWMSNFYCKGNKGKDIKKTGNV